MTNEEIDRHIVIALGFADTGAIPVECLPQSFACAAIAILTKITEEKCGHKECLKLRIEGLKRLVDSYGEFMIFTMEEKADIEEHKTLN